MICIPTVFRLYVEMKGLPYLFFVPVLMLNGFWLGVGPAVFSTLLAMLSAEYFFVGTAFAFDRNLNEWLDNFSFAIVSGAMAIVCARFRRTLGLLRDANRRLEKEVDARIQERDQIWHHSPDMICTFSHEGRLLSVNPAWQHILGWTPGQLTGTPLDAFLHPDDVAAWHDSIRHPRSFLTVENRFRSETQDYRWLSWHVAHQDGIYFGTVRDVTEFKTQQSALDKSQEQLRQSQKMEAIGQLTGGIAHDFNNLLAGIMGSHDLMSLRIRQGRFDELERYMAMSRGATERAAALTHRLLAYGRRQPLSARAVDANQLIDGMRELVVRALGPQISLDMLLATELWAAWCDPHQLDNAVLNLAINSRDAMPRGGRLFIETTNTRFDESSAGAAQIAAGEYVCISVTDTGEGMPADVLERAFDPFFTTKPVGTGTGLGLSMIQGFVKQSNGHIRIHSHVGRGTTVRLFLPRHAALPDMPQPIEPVVSPLRRAADATVMIVDDESSVRAVLVECLSDAGYRTLEAGDGPAALTALDAAGSVDLLITDVGLPNGMNGWELAEAARRTRPDLRVLFITGYAGDAVLRDRDETEKTQLLTKPFTLETLRQRTTEMMRRSWSGQGADAGPVARQAMQSARRDVATAP